MAILSKGVAGPQKTYVRKSASLGLLKRRHHFGRVRSVDLPLYGPPRKKRPVEKPRSIPLEPSASYVDKHVVFDCVRRIPSQEKREAMPFTKQRVSFAPATGEPVKPQLQPSKASRSNEKDRSRPKSFRDLLKPEDFIVPRRVVPPPYPKLHSVPDPLNPSKTIYMYAFGPPEDYLNFKDDPVRRAMESPPKKVVSKCDKPISNSATTVQADAVSSPQIGGARIKVPPKEEPSPSTSFEAYYPEGDSKKWDTSLDDTNKLGGIFLDDSPSTKPPAAPNTKTEAVRNPYANTYTDAPPPPPYYVGNVGEAAYDYYEPAYSPYPPYYAYPPPGPSFRYYNYRPANPTFDVDLRDHNYNLPPPPPPPDVADPNFSFSSIPLPPPPMPPN